MVEYTDEIFIYEHNKKPRGIGSWAFRFDNDTKMNWFDGLYSQAKKQAITKAKELGIKKVFLLS